MCLTCCQREPHRQAVGIDEGMKDAFDEIMAPPSNANTNRSASSQLPGLQLGRAITADPFHVFAGISPS